MIDYGNLIPPYAADPAPAAKREILDRVASASKAKAGATAAVLRTAIALPGVEIPVRVSRKAGALVVVRTDLGTERDITASLSVAERAEMAARLMGKEKNDA